MCSIVSFFMFFTCICRIVINITYLLTYVHLPNLLMTALHSDNAVTGLRDVVTCEIIILKTIRIITVIIVM